MRVILGMLVATTLGATVGLLVSYIYVQWFMDVDMWLLYVIEGAIGGAVLGVATYCFTIIRRRRQRAA